MLIVDANILIAALLKDSQVRKLLTQINELLLAPEVIFSEVEKHKLELLSKSRITNEEFEETLTILSKHLVIVKSDKIIDYIEEAEEIIKSIDENDVPIVATSLAYNYSPIWTDDKHFQKQKKIKIYTTKELLETIS